MEEVEAQPPTYLKCVLSLALGLAPMFLIFGFAALGGFDTVRINRQPVHGVPALLISVVAPLILAAVLAAFQKLGFAILTIIPRRRADANA